MCWGAGDGFQGGDLCVLLEMGEGGGGRMQQVICYRTGDKIWRRGMRDEDLQLACFSGWSATFYLLMNS